MDFSKLPSAEEIKSKRETRIIVENMQHKANVFMTDSLFKMVIEGKIDNEYDRKFIKSVRTYITIHQSLTEKQEEYLEELFHNKY